MTDSPTPTARHLEAVDEPAVLQLLADFAAVNPSPSSSWNEDLAAAQGQLACPLPAGTAVAVADVNGQAVGMLAVTAAPSFVHGGRPIAVVTLIVVNPQWRRHGIASLLLSWVATWARERDAYKLLVEVRSNNDPAIAMYAARGFMRAGDAWARYL